MFWMLAMGAASALKTGVENKQKQKDIKASNKVAQAADDATIANAFREISSFNVQNGLLRVQAGRELNEAQKAAYSATGTVTANAAAAQVKGASVDATIADIDRELGEARVATEQALEMGQYNIQQRITSTLNSASNSLIGLTDPHSQDASPLFAALSTMGSSYMGNQMKFGGGSSFFSETPPVRGGGATSFGAPDTAAGLTFSTGT